MHANTPIVRTCVSNKYGYHISAYIIYEYAYHTNILYIRVQKGYYTRDIYKRYLASLSHSYSTFPLCLRTTLIEIACIRVYTHVSNVADTHTVYVRISNMVDTHIHMICYAYDSHIKPVPKYLVPKYHILKPT